jgi:hypothetical protein
MRRCPSATGRGGLRGEAAAAFAMRSMDEREALNSGLSEIWEVAATASQ